MKYQSLDNLLTWNHKQQDNVAAAIVIIFLSFCMFLQCKTLSFLNATVYICIGATSLQEASPCQKDNLITSMYSTVWKQSRPTLLYQAAVQDIKDVLGCLMLRQVKPPVLLQLQLQAQCCCTVLHNSTYLFGVVAAWIQ